MCCHTDPVSETRLRISCSAPVVADKLTRRGLSILAPALTGTVLVPVLASKVNDLLGIDISDLTNLLTNPSGAQTPARTKKKARKNGGKKGGKKNGKKGKKNKRDSAG